MQREPRAFVNARLARTSKHSKNVNERKPSQEQWLFVKRSEQSRRQRRSLLKSKSYFTQLFARTIKEWTEGCSLSFQNGADALEHQREADANTLSGEEYKDNIYAKREEKQKNGN
jgi:hypothetical protein